jgi:hypothetical protein
MSTKPRALTLIAALFLIGACTGTPTSAPSADAQRDAIPSQDGGWGYGSGGWSEQDTASVATTSADSAVGRGGGGAIGSGN